MNNNVSYKDYRSTYLKMASLFCIDGPVSVETISNLIYIINKEYLDEQTLLKISNAGYTADELSNDDIEKATDETIKYNITEYFKGMKPILLSDCTILDDQKQVFMYYENLINGIKELPQADAINCYIELKDTILHGNLDGYDRLNKTQQDLIGKIILSVANNIADYRKDAKQYKITQ